MKTHTALRLSGECATKNKTTKPRGWRPLRERARYFFILAACCSVNFVFASTWEELGGSASGEGLGGPGLWTESGSLAFDHEGNLIVAWNATSYDIPGDPSNVYVRKWNGTAWEDLGTGSSTGGGITNASGRAIEPKVVVMGDGSPVVAWAQDGMLYIRKWDGQQWSEIGQGSATGGGISGEQNWASLQDMVVGGDGNPIPVWLSNPRGASGGGVYVKRWNGQKWTEMDMWSAQYGGISGGPASSPRAAVDDEGNPWVVWAKTGQWDSKYQVYLKKWDGRVWVEAPGGSASGDGISQSPTGAVWPGITTFGSKVYLIWMEMTEEFGKHLSYLVHWNGASWEETMEHSASGAGVLPPGVEGREIAIDQNGRILLCWTMMRRSPLPEPAEVFAKAWDGAAWRELSQGSSLAGGITNAGGESFPRAWAVDPENRPVLLWGFRESLDNTGPYKLYLRRLNPETNPDAPIVTIQTPEGYQLEEIAFEYTLSNASSDTCGVYPHYSVDGGISWKVATPATGGDGVTGLASSPQGVPHVFIWDSAADEPSPAYDQTQFRLIPYDNKLVGVCEPTDNFPLYKDADGDGMHDGWEIQYFGDRSQPPGGDFDGDGLTNLAEFNTGTNPTDNDTDDDNLLDGEELLRNTGPLDPDTDDDGLLDGEEVKVHGTNPLVGDSDSDGMPDHWEVTHGLDPNADDARGNPDGDLLTNLEEFRYGTHPQDGSSPPTIYVDAANMGNEDGSFEHPYNTIQEAIDSAGGEARVVQARSGVYIENVLLADGIFLVGEGRDLTSIDAGGAGSAITMVGVSTQLW